MLPDPLRRIPRFFRFCTDMSHALTGPGSPEVGSYGGGDVLPDPLHRIPHFFRFCMDTSHAFAGPGSPEVGSYGGDNVLPDPLRRIPRFFRFSADYAREDRGDDEAAFPMANVRQQSRLVLVREADCRGVYVRHGSRQPAAAWRVLAESTTAIRGRRRRRLVSGIRGGGRVVVILLSMRDHRARVGGGCGGGGAGEPRRRRRHEQAVQSSVGPASVLRPPSRFPRGIAALCCSSCRVRGTFTGWRSRPGRQ